MTGGPEGRLVLYVYNHVFKVVCILRCRPRLLFLGVYNHVNLKSYVLKIVCIKNPAVLRAKYIARAIYCAQNPSYPP